MSGIASTTELRALRVIAGDIESPILVLLTASTTDLGARFARLKKKHQ